MVFTVISTGSSSPICITTEAKREYAHYPNTKFKVPTLSGDSFEPIVQYDNTLLPRVVDGPAIICAGEGRARS